MQLKSVNTIALINLGYVGDIINSSPLCLELKRAYPTARLIYITMLPGLETAKCLPEVDEVLVYDRRGKHKGVFNLVKLANEIKSKEKIDTAILLTDSLRCALFAFLLGAKKRIGRAFREDLCCLRTKFP